MFSLSSPDRRGTPASLLVVGLGNPGEEHSRTRHNAGADVVELLAKRNGASLKSSKKDHARVADTRIDGELVILAFPQTYMNDSGKSAVALAKRASLASWDRLVVVHDELDLPLGSVRVKVGGGLAGHNGLRSITNHLKTQDYARIRIGVGKPPGGKEHGADHVLRKLRGSDAKVWDDIVSLAADAVEEILRNGHDAAMAKFNNS